MMSMIIIAPLFLPILIVLSLFPPPSLPRGGVVTGDSIFFIGQTFTAGHVNCSTWPTLKTSRPRVSTMLETVARVIIPLTRCDYGSDAFSAGIQVSQVARRRVGGSAVS